jgi:ribonuclease P protein component
MSADRAEGTEAFRRSQRVRRRREYLRCYRQGRRFFGPLTTVHVALSDQGTTRLGITASRKVGDAVARHRLKRRVREIFRRWPERPALPAVDIVVDLQKGAAQADFHALQRELEQVFARLLRRKTDGQ